MKPQLKLACADFAFPLLSHDRVLDLIAMLEFEGVDVGLFEGRSHLWPSREFQATAKSGKALGQKLADRGLQLADVILRRIPVLPGTPSTIRHPPGAGAPGIGFAKPSNTRPREMPGTSPRFPESALKRSPPRLPGSAPARNWPGG